MTDTRPDERRRLRTFALVAMLLALAAIALSGTNRPGMENEPAGVTATTFEASPPPVAEPDAVPRIRQARRPTARLRRTAQRFMRTYLPYLYGQAPLRSLERAAPELRRRLARGERRVPPAARRRRPHVRVLLLGGLVRDARAWRVTARVADGDVAVYPIELLIAERRGRLAVIQTGGE